MDNSAPIQNAALPMNTPMTSESVYHSLDDALKDATQVFALNLSGQTLSELPSQLASLTNLRELDLSFCGLTKLSPIISHLTNLQRLNLYANSLTDLPAEMDKSG